MPATAAASSLMSLPAAVRAHLGLSVRQLGRYLGVSASFIAHLEMGRKGLPLALLPRLLLLSALLPPPLGQGPPAWPAPPVFYPLDPLPLPEAFVGELPAAVPPAAAALRRRLRDCRLLMLTQGQHLAQRQTRAAALAHRRRGLAQLQAAPAATEPTEAAHYARWLHNLALDLDRDEPNPAAASAARLVLAARVAGLRAEVAALTAALAA
jgi:transcriptional regulator with XRE-family HTH domain